jgi:hypothetical protein
MLRGLVLGLAILGLAGTVSAGDLFAGKWKLSVTKSKFTAGMGFRALSVEVVEAGANLAISAKGTDSAGKATSTKYTFPVTGGSLTFTEGAPASGTTVAVARLGANTIDSITTVNGFQVGTALSTVSGDGKTLTRVEKGIDAAGKVFTNTEVYERQ